MLLILAAFKRMQAIEKSLKMISMTAGYLTSSDHEQVT